MRTSSPPDRSARPAPTPPATPQELIAARRPRKQWPWDFLLGGFVLLGVRYLIRSVHPSTPAQIQVVDLIRSLAVPVGVMAMVFGLLAVLLRAVTEPRGSAPTRVLAAAGRGLHLGPNQLRLAKPKWKGVWRRCRHTRRLQSAQLRYEPGHVIEDLSRDLEEALEPFAAADLMVRWEPDWDRFIIAARPPVAARIEDTAKPVGLMVRILEHLMGELQVDQDATVLGADGEVDNFVATYPYTTRDTAESFRQRIKYQLDAKAPCPTGYWQVRLNPANSQITITPSQPMPTLAPLPLSNLAEEDRLQLPVGVGAGGEVVIWDPTVFPHMLLVGPTGSGKTIFINSCIDLAVARHWQVDLLDPKELSYRGYIPATLTELGRPTWPGIETVATSELEMEEAIDAAYDRLREVYHQLKIFGVIEDDLTPRLLIIDEAGELVERLNAWHTSDAKYLALVEKAIRNGEDPETVAKPKGTRNPVLLKIWSLLRLGRQARIFVITATQRPDVNFIPGEARANLTCRVAMGKQDGAALDMVFGTRTIQQRVHDTVVDPVTGERKLTRIRGRATVDVGSGPQSVQTYWTPDPAILIHRGKASQADVDLATRQFAWVCQSAAQWGGDSPINPEWTGFNTPAPADVVDRKAKIVDAALNADLHKPEPAPKRKKNDKGRRADSLAVGDVAVMDIDGEELSVEITQIEDDPTFMGEEQEVHELLISYRIADGHARAGEEATTTLADDERVLVEA